MYHVNVYIINKREGEEEDNGVTNCHHLSRDVTIDFSKGSRDNSLFHVANCLVKGGMSNDNAIKTLEIIASNCS